MSLNTFIVFSLVLLLVIAGFSFRNLSNEQGRVEGSHAIALSNAAFRIAFQPITINGDPKIEISEYWISIMNSNKVILISKPEMTVHEIYRTFLDIHTLSINTNWFQYYQKNMPKESDPVSE